MSAEDLDKLFRDKLQNRPVTPSNDVWERMQARMQANAQEETPNPFMIPAATEQQEERTPIRMWYYSAAAAVTMLLSVGLWVNRENIDLMQSSGSVASVQQQNTSAPTATEPTAEAVKSPESNFSKNTTTAEQSRTEVLASVDTKNNTDDAASRVISVAKENEFSSAKPNRAVVPVSRRIASEPVMVAVNAPGKSQQETLTNSEAASLVIIVKFDNSQATTSFASASTTVDTTPQEEETPTGSGRVLKGILKQVKNLKEGEKVNLAELGIAKHTYALETRIGNKKITKTIEL